MLADELLHHEVEGRVNRLVEELEELVSNVAEEVAEIRGIVAATEPPIIQNIILNAGVLTDEAVRNGSLKKSGEKRGDGGELSKEGNFKNDNKRTRTGKVFATITNPVKKEYTSSAPKCINCPSHHYPETPCCVCTNCNRLGHFAKDCRAGPKMVTPLNAKNPTAAHGVCYECGGIVHYKPIRRIHQGRYGASVPALTKDHKRNEDQYAVSRGLNTPYSRYGINIIFWKISNVSFRFSKKSLMRRIQYMDTQCV
ncbi:reverse transcriptase domain-containing protein [Tanacetum coccineum]